MTLQTVAREGEDDEPEVELEWAFVRWFVSDAVALRVGRLALPAFAMSDHGEVGYAITSVRPPEDIYAQIPLRRYTGADLTLTGSRGETSYALQVGAGPMEETLPGDLRVTGDDAWAANPRARARPGTTSPEPACPRASRPTRAISTRSARRSRRRPRSCPGSRT